MTPCSRVDLCACQPAASLAVAVKVAVAFDCAVAFEKENAMPTGHCLEDQLVNNMVPCCLLSH